ncbi:response regulator [Acidimangrovimonas pyrenivorans]|uniref:Response regulator n=1 Tax=Acidimangrovimonas pyrenivorans TaxID=2030798 RepID=A0ABV7AGD4_9RHOB
MRIIIVDDHPIFRSGLRRVLEDYGHSVVAENGDGASGVASVRDQSPDLVLMDLQMPGCDGLSALKALRGDPPVVVLTVSEDASDLAAAMEAGASGYVLKNTDSGELVQVLETVASGYRIYPDPPAGRRDAPARLSARQRNVLEGLVRGMTHKEIARKLGISQFTVRTYQERLLEKFGVGSRAELIFAASGGTPPEQGGAAAE